jgi:putative molybdopterin biosynthesis protein
MLEEEARQLGISPEELKKRLTGYTFEVKTHEAVAYLISRGIVDVGIGVKYIAERYGLDFKPITSERYDIVIRKEAYTNEIVSQIIDKIRSLDKTELPTGYSLDKKTGTIIEL